jgi:hypothetical protein
LASSIQLGRREREKGTVHDALSIQHSSVSKESHWFDLKSLKTMGLATQDPSFSHLHASSSSFFFFDKLNFVKLGKLGLSLSSFINFNQI